MLDSYTATELDIISDVSSLSFHTILICSSNRYKEDDYHSDDQHEVECRSGPMRRILDSHNAHHPVDCEKRLQHQTQSQITLQLVTFCVPCQFPGHRVHVKKVQEAFVLNKFGLGGLLLRRKCFRELED